MTFRKTAKLLGLRPASPFDAINIDHQRLIIHRTSLPDSRAGPAVINCPLNQSRAHWTEMNVVDLLHKRCFAEDRKDILFLLPKRMRVFSLPLFMAQLCQKNS